MSIAQRIQEAKFAGRLSPDHWARPRLLLQAIPYVPTHHRETARPFSSLFSKDRTMSDNITSILNDLVETSKDGEKGFRSAAEDTKNAELRAVFLKRADDCATGAADLQQW